MEFEPPFPEDFLWAPPPQGFESTWVATWTAEQCEDRASDWYQWVTTESIVADANLHVAGEPVSSGPGMWELFEQDVEQMAKDGMNAYRMSLEWSRLFPDAEAETADSVAALAAFANPEAVTRYHEMFAALRDADIEPLVTLNHYTLPLWVHDGVACHEDPDGCEANGWVNGERIVPLVELYAGFVGQEFGADVDQWATLNEPFATTLSGYAFPSEDRSAPPGLNLDIPKVVAVMHNQIVGHAEMFHALKAFDTTDANGDGSAATVGIVMNMTAIEPADPANEADVRGAANMNYLYTGSTSRHRRVGPDPRRCRRCQRSELANTLITDQLLQPRIGHRLPLPSLQGDPGLRLLPRVQLGALHTRPRRCLGRSLDLRLADRGDRERHALRRRPRERGPARPSLTNRGPHLRRNGRGRLLLLVLHRQLRVEPRV